MMQTLRTRFHAWRYARLARQITLDAARRRARRGADYLDDADPGWFARLDAATLELSDGSCCVLGQLHGEFRLGLGRSALLDLSSAPRANLSPVRLGFLCRQDVPEPLQALDYAHLNQAWHDEIAQRQQDSASQPEPWLPLERVVATAGV